MQKLFEVKPIANRLMGVEESNIGRWCDNRM